MKEPTGLFAPGTARHYTALWNAATFYVCVMTVVALFVCLKMEESGYGGIRGALFVCVCVYCMYCMSTWKFPLSSALSAHRAREEVQRGKTNLTSSDHVHVRSLN